MAEIEEVNYEAANNNEVGNVPQPLHNFAIKPTWDNKGNGIFTNVEINTGTIIVQEFPVMRHYERPQGFDNALIPGLIQQYDSLRREVQDELLTLHCKRMDDEDDGPVFEFMRNYTRANGARLTLPECRMYTRVVVILWSCQIGFLDKNGDEHRALYLHTSRFNHRCWPNVILNITTDGYITLRARHRILQGAELTISYIEMNNLRNTRRQMLLQEFGFECQCDVCDEEDLRPDAGMYEARVAELQIYDMGETMRMYRENLFHQLPLEDARQLLKRCTKRWVLYCKLFWNDYAFYEMCNIADLWARWWQLTPNNNPPINPQARYLWTEWRKAMNALGQLAPRIMDPDDHHLVSVRQAAAVGYPNIIPPQPLAEDEAANSPTPQGRARRARSATPFGEPEPLDADSPGYNSSGP
ncbi:hypothetical protein PG989_015465 [Apiospora arundinis]|uniref:SET domain-containing protein n=1 Tax=Apiospora arundinis TaxID=335852 RepID=A0ABR2JIW0_9PEZI